MNSFGSLISTYIIIEPYPNDEFSRAVQSWKLKVQHMMRGGANITVIHDFSTNKDVIDAFPDNYFVVVTKSGKTSYMPHGVGNIFIHTLLQLKARMEKRKPHGVEYTRELKSLRKKIISTGFILRKDVRGGITPEETIPHTSLLSKADINTSFHS